MLDYLKSVIIFYLILGFVQILDAGMDVHTFIIKSDSLMYQNLKKIGKNYSNCTCDVGNDSCYQYTITVDRRVDNCSVYGFLRSENTTIPNQAIDVSTSSKYILESASPDAPDESGKGGKIAIITISSIGAVGATGVAGYYLTNVVMNMLQSNTYKL